MELVCIAVFSFPMCFCVLKRNASEKPGKAAFARIRPCLPKTDMTGLNNRPAGFRLPAGCEAAGLAAKRHAGPPAVLTRARQTEIRPGAAKKGPPDREAPFPLFLPARSSEKGAIQAFARRSQEFCLALRPEIRAARPLIEVD